MLLVQIIKSEIKNRFEDIVCSILRIFAVVIVPVFLLGIITVIGIHGSKTKYKVKDNLTEISKQYKDSQKSKEESK